MQPSITPVNGPNSHAPNGGNAFSGWLGRTLLQITGWHFENTMPQHPKMVFAVGPHTSNWDFFLGVSVLFALRIRINFLGKHSIFVPVIKQLLGFIGGIAVDRKAGNGVVGQVVERFAAKEKMILAVAPEGTRSPIYPWKTGFLAIAQQSHAKVVLIGFDFARKKVVFGPCFTCSEDLQMDMQKVYAFFDSIPAKYPQNAITRQP